ncbi:hypothetical protein BSL78_26125 [Apostichopus japonicus]|uniref:Uncharacterized protein n=1 Tax=Stichopus japonicus TaxID=307972 RepID=A0A2G8JMQ8_STIJA|nr:hypothetical protein BSL78_26125 [Apostichopus japonicus]
MNEWKQKWKKGKDKPTGLNESVWNDFIRYWESSSAEVISKANLGNRKSDRGGKGIYIHNAGSTSFLRRADQLYHFQRVVIQDSGELQILVPQHLQMDYVVGNFRRKLLSETCCDILTVINHQEISSDQIPDGGSHRKMSLDNSLVIPDGCGPSNIRRYFPLTISIETPRKFPTAYLIANPRKFPIIPTESIF